MLRSFLPCALVGASLLALATADVSAQSAPELPAPSPKARVEQRVGLVDFSVDYSSPAVKARQIWGGLVPYDRPWRTGANAATKLTASKDFVFAGKAVPAGSYALYTIPGKASWTSPASIPELPCLDTLNAAELTKRSWVNNQR